ncbi:GntR family transcriptional regulator [Hydrogenophaga intermedia]|jgi:DNA-binding GntR family transcriptional regulator|uniref:GntR family transcriptional regulator n=1 Tax=Hydrogenophaga intermedia TaxID=65786 RepID=A0A1L1PG64_HYDIT|nr:GntR family transcriptional regulator [Hydrogenophaga intermedia]TMU72331.1 GntR family transcriptional regulator [Hydrogenophaga intermedia]CDN89062.1 GntR family transcriptional regulator [Hydrogenophaga intermedia]
MPNAAAPSRKKPPRRAAARAADLDVDPQPPRAAGALADAEGDDVEARIYRAVFESVMSQRLPPGTKLPEAPLCELFGVSRAVVRKVLQKLAHDHIVQLRPNRGATVAVPTREETQQIFEARRALEAAIVRLVAERATPADLKALRAQLQAETKVMHRHDQPAWARLASTYHLRLAELSGNPILHRYLVEIVSRCSLIVALHQPPGNAACEHDEHEGIVERIARGDADGAVALMDRHLRDLERHLMLDKPAPRKDLAHLLGLG